MNKIDFWDSLINDVTPFLEIGKQLLDDINNAVTIANIDYVHFTDYTCLPTSLKDSIGLAIQKVISKAANVNKLSLLIQSKDIYISVIKMLEVEFINSKKDDKLIRSVLITQIQNVMNASISASTMNLNDWKIYIDSIKETQDIDYPIEYAYRKLCKQDLLKEKVEIKNFFYNIHPWPEIEKLLSEAKESLCLANEHRNTTSKRGQGTTRLIIDFIFKWQTNGYMKNVHRIYPFIQCLNEYWNNELNLGTRQGVERSYKQRH